jgi:hypothetical protein
MKNKWILFAVALVIIAINLLNGDFSAYKQLSAVDLLPVIAIALVSFLIKTGVLSAAVIGIKKLWQWLWKNKRRRPRQSHRRGHRCLCPTGN